MTVLMKPSRWIELMNRSKTVQPFILCDFDRRLGRDMFACIAGPSVAAISAFFEQAEEQELLHECIEGLFSVARIAQYGLEDTLDELIATFLRFTTMLNPYDSAEETLFAFSKYLKPRMATLAIFTIANNFGESIRGGWRNIVDCLLKLKRLKLLPQNVLEFDAASTSSDAQPTSESGIIFPAHDPKFGGRQASGMISRFSHFLSLESPEDAVSLGMSEFEQNLKVIKQCRIGDIFSTSSNFPEDSLLNLGRSLIYAAAGKGQKFSTSIEKEVTVGFCWDLIVAISLANVHRFQAFWLSFHDYLLAVAQFPMFSPIPFSEKAIVGLFKKFSDTCSESITQSVNKILVEYPANLQTQLGWKSVLHLLSVSGRHPDTYWQGVETLIMVMSDGTHVSRTNYAYCIDHAFGFIALKNSPLEKNLKILDLLADSLGEAFQKISLARREEIRNHAVLSLQKSFKLAEELEFTPTNYTNCFNLVIFVMVDDLHKKMLEYSQRENAEKEMRGMEGTLKIALELLTDVKMITEMKMKEILVQEGDDLWELTHIQIQWIAPSIKEELFPEESL
ncbi:hypothetical protein ACFX2J_017637 [Malus domestica]